MAPVAPISVETLQPKGPAFNHIGGLNLSAVGFEVVTDPTARTLAIKWPKVMMSIGSGNTKQEVEVSYYEIQFQKKDAAGLYVEFAVGGSSPVKVLPPSPLPTNDAGIRTYTSPQLAYGDYQFRITGRDNAFPNGDGHTGWTAWSTFGFQLALKKPTISFSPLPAAPVYGGIFELTASSYYENAATGLAVILSLDAKSAGCTLTPKTGGYTVSLDAATAAGATPTDGYCIINADQAASGDFDEAHATQSFLISKATPAITLVGLPTAAVIYDGQEHGATSATVTGVRAENLTINSIKYDDAADPNDVPTTSKPKDAGTYNVVAYFDETANYNAATKSGSLTISPAALSITARATPARKPYDGTAFDPQTFSVDFNGFVNNETSTVLAGLATLQFIQPTTDADNHAYPGAGVYSLGLSGTVTARNYTITLNPGTLTIDKVSLTVTAKATPSTKVYDGAGFDSKTFGVDYSGFVNNETSSVLTGPVQYAVTLLTPLYAAPYNVSPYPGTYELTPSGLTSDNYNITFLEATLTIGTWTFQGFYQPVDMTPAGQPTVYNTVKGGSTVPFKFEVLKGTTELKDLAVVKPLIAKGIPCNVTITDEIEILATGATVLRFDVTGDQFIYNWQTPKSPGTCYAVTISTADGSSKTANFQIK